MIAPAEIERVVQKRSERLEPVEQVRRRHKPEVFPVVAPRLHSDGPIELVVMDVSPCDRGNAITGLHRSAGDEDVQVLEAAALVGDELAEEDFAVGVDLD